MRANAKLLAVIGLGIAVSASAVLQSVQAGADQAEWRPIVLISAALAGIVAVWQLFAVAVWDARRTPAPPSGSPGNDDLHRGDADPTAAPGSPLTARLSMIFSVLALIAALVAVLLQLRPPHSMALTPVTPSAAASGLDTRASMSPSASPSSGPTPILSQTGAEPPPSKKAPPPCIAGSWSMTVGELYSEVDTPPAERFTKTAGGASRHYSADGTGGIDYIGYTLLAVGSQDGIQYTYTFDGSATFTYTTAAGKLTHTLTAHDGTVTFTRNGETQAVNPITYFPAGSEAYSCSAGALTVDNAALHEVYTRN